MKPVHCEKKGENEYALGIDSGGKDDVASVVDTSLGMYSARFIAPASSSEKLTTWFCIHVL